MPYFQATIRGQAFNISPNLRYATFQGGGRYLYVSDPAQLPRIFRWRWVPAQDPAAPDITFRGFRFAAYRPVFRAPGGFDAPVELPSDCINAAQIVSSGMSNQPISQLAGFPEPADAVAGGRGVLGPVPGQVQAGRAYIGYRGAGGPGDFHSASIVAQDGPTAITMESDIPANAPAGDVDVLRPPIFDMYSEDVAAQSFYAGQGGGATLVAVVDPVADPIAAGGDNGMSASIFADMQTVTVNAVMETMELSAAEIAEILAILALL